MWWVNNLKKKAKNLNDDQVRKIFLLGIFLLAIVVRFWWFPGNVYFGYDQARDAIVSQEIYQGDLKIIGPSAGKEGLYHGPLYWYLIGPVYLAAGGNPAVVLAFIAILNALGVFLIYFFGQKLFDQKVGLWAALLFAFSFAESQYALYFANPAPAVLSIMAFYLGWALLIFQKKAWGWLLVGLGLGLSVQFEFFLIYLAVSAVFLPLCFWREIKTNFQFKFFLLGIGSLVLTLSTFFLAEVKYGFKTTKVLLATFLGKSPEPTVHLATSNFLERLGMEVYYEPLKFFPQSRNFLAVGLFLLIVFALIKFKGERKQILFTLAWILSNFFLDSFGPPQLYYVGIGLAIPVIFIFAFFLQRIFKQQKLLALALLLFFIFTQGQLMKKYNPTGPVMDLYVQKGMLLTDEKKVVERVYKEAKGEKFTVNALTMPYKIKTTWAYLFNWYGKQKYGYLPFWGGEDVPGYAGSLPLPDSRKYVRFAIYEPMRGIPEDLKKEFAASENGYQKPAFKENIGLFELEKRLP